MVVVMGHMQTELTRDRSRRYTVQEIRRVKSTDAC